MRRILPFLAIGAMAFTLSAQYPGSLPPGPGYPNPGYPPAQGYPPQGYPGQNPNPNLPDDVPGQPVARIGVLNGDASIQHRDSGEWTAAVVNAPLTAGDAISLPPGSRAELQLDFGNFVRIDGDTELRFAAFDGAHAQIQLSRGSITWRALRDSPLRVEISTPVVAVHPERLSAVRIEAAADGSTRVTVRRGEAEASTPRGTEHVREASTMLVHGAPDGNAEYQMVPAAPPDAWDSWNDQRDGFLSRAQSNRYVSPDIYGAEDLDAAGRWGYDPNYGNVWTPNVPPGWAPYSDGSWVWVDPYGWTWVDAMPWGWAPFHYGSWYFRVGFGWTWFPGSRLAHYWWHPAMVGFFGFGSNIGWVPLAPYERFRPWYGPGVTVGVGFGFGRTVGVV
ncbi:MAG TPA: FecR family protein, partial [Bryobacteraceae bacterium]|nr:FecR family protein [Bryobacteraceae bacterium]